MPTHFHPNPQYDIEGYEQIKNFLHLEPAQNFAAPKDQQEVIDRVALVHTNHATELNERTNEIATTWHTKEQAFTDLALQYFDPEDLPTETYECYPTIWPLIARDPVQHRIAFPYQESEMGACAVIAHELLHEVFFRHLHRKFGDQVNLHTQAVWDLSEVVNVLILNEPNWQALFPIPAFPYPQHKELLNALTSAGSATYKIDTLVQKALDLHKA